MEIKRILKNSIRGQKSRKWLFNPNKLQKTFKSVNKSNIGTPKPFYSDGGILMMNVYDFLLDPDSLEF